MLNFLKSLIGRKKHNFAEFTAKVTKLTKQYKIVIAGCGCCGSPYLYEMDRDGEYVWHEGKPPLHHGDLDFQTYEVEE